MTQNEVETYCKNNGVPVVRVGERLRVMDKTQLPMHMREALDDRGFLNSEPVETLPDVTEIKEAESVGETEEAEEVNETEAEEAPVQAKAKPKKAAKKK